MGNPLISCHGIRCSEIHGGHGYGRATFAYRYRALVGLSRRCLRRGAKANASILSGAARRSRRGRRRSSDVLSVPLVRFPAAPSAGHQERHLWPGSTGPPSRRRRARGREKSSGRTPPVWRAGKASVDRIRRIPSESNSRIPWADQPGIGFRAGLPGRSGDRQRRIGRRRPGCAQSPAMVMRSISQEPVRLLPRVSTSLPTARSPRYMSARLPAMVISSTG